LLPAQLSWAWVFVTTTTLQAREGGPRSRHGLGQSAWRVGYHGQVGGRRFTIDRSSDGR
jgi:hypothetical protein